MNGEPRKKHHTGKWELVVQKATRSLQEMLRAASQRRRNVIIDQVGAFRSIKRVVFVQLCRLLKLTDVLPKFLREK